MTDYNNLFEIFKNNEKELDLPLLKNREKEKGKKKDEEKENIQTRIILYNGRQYYGKIVVQDENIDNLLKKIKGPNILKIFKFYKEKISNTDYNLIIMEKAVLGNLAKLFDFLREKQLNNINYAFPEIISDNLLRFFAKQIVKGLETLEKSEIIHLNIKAENLLLSYGLRLKISGFLYSQKLKKGSDIDSKIMNKKSYHSPESCQEEKKFDIDTAKKQDYYSLGATLFLLKLGSQMLDYNEYGENGWSEDRVIDLLQRDIAHLQSYPLIDSNLIDFICDLLAYIPEERPTFEEIYRNKWLNENANEIELIYRGFLEETEETKTMEELIKSDFLMEKKNNLKMNDKKNENILKKDNKKRNFKFIPMEKKK
jgi:serine/threonine protein kinase